MHPMVLPLPDRQKCPNLFPRIVSQLDRIRFILDDRDDMAEFYWFAREYPRAYRHHVGHAESDWTAFMIHSSICINMGQEKALQLGPH